MKSEELKCMEALNDKYSGSKWWMPLVWATNIVVRARQENKIKSDPGVQTLLSELSRIRHGLTKVQHYDTLSVPLVYTQVYTNSMANLRFLGPKSWSSVVALTSFHWKVNIFFGDKSLSLRLYELATSPKKVSIPTAQSLIVTKNVPFEFSNFGILHQIWPLKSCNTVWQQA